MRKIYLPILFCLFSVASVRAQSSCNCNITPFSPNPPCFNTCTCSLLARSGMRELRDILHLPMDTIERILSWEGRFSARSLQEYRAVLSASELLDVAQKMNSLTDGDARALNRAAGGEGDAVTRLNRIGAGGGGGSGGLGGRGESSVTTANIQSPPPERGLSYAYAENEKHEWRWKVMTADGRVIGLSAGGYKTEADCLADIEKLKNSKDATIKKE